MQIYSTMRVRHTTADHFQDAVASDSFIGHFAKIVAPPQGTDIIVRKNR